MTDAPERLCVVFEVRRTIPLAELDSIIRDLGEGASGGSPSGAEWGLDGTIRMADVDPSAVPRILAVYLGCPWREKKHPRILIGPSGGVLEPVDLGGGRFRRRKDYPEMWREIRNILWGGKWDR